MQICAPEKQNFRSLKLAFHVFILIHPFALLPLSCDWNLKMKVKQKNERETRGNICSCKHNHGNYLVCLIESFAWVVVREIPMKVFKLRININFDHIIDSHTSTV